MNNPLQNLNTSCLIRGCSGTYQVHHHHVNVDGDIMYCLECSNNPKHVARAIKPTDRDIKAIFRIHLGRWGWPKICKARV